MLLLPYGSAFPVDAWPAIRDFVRAGGSLVVLGGAPFHQPVRLEKGAWTAGFRQPTYARELLIGPAQELDLASFSGPLKSVAVDGAGWTVPLPEAKRTWALTLRLTDKEDLPGQDGSAGPREGVARPLVHVLDAEGLPRACPLLEVDRLRGRGRAGAGCSHRPTRASAGDDPCGRRAGALEGAAGARRAPRARRRRGRRSAVLRILVNRPLARRASRRRGRASGADDAGQTVFAGEATLGGTAESRLLRAIAPRGWPLGQLCHRASIGRRSSWPKAIWHRVPSSPVSG